MIPAGTKQELFEHSLLLAVGDVSATTEFYTVLHSPWCGLVGQEIINLRANTHHTDRIRISFTKYCSLDLPAIQQ